MVALSPTKLWAVSLPLNSFNFRMSLKSVEWSMHHISMSGMKHLIHSGYSNINISENTQILGTVTKDSIDFDPEPYLEKNIVFTTAKFTVYDKHITYTPFKDYSFYSLLSANGLHFVNNELPPPYEVISEATKLIKEFPNDDLLKHSLEQSEHIKNAFQAADNALVQKLLILKEI